MKDTYLINTIIKAVKDYKKDFKITCIDRTPDEQAVLVKEGKSKTLKSKHLEGKAVDVMCNNGWDLKDYKEFAELVKKYDTKKIIKWGGEWVGFCDAVHFEV